MDPVDIAFAALSGVWCAAWGYVFWTGCRARREVTEIAAMARARRAEPG